MRVRAITDVRVWGIADVRAKISHVRVQTDKSRAVRAIRDVRVHVRVHDPHL